MAIFNPTFVFGILVLTYLSTFILFALLRIITGISIQRVGYLSLRHIAYTPKDGVRLDIRGLGFVLHRPTFAQPTWLSLVVEELHITLDLEVLGGESIETLHGESESEDQLDPGSSRTRPSEKQDGGTRTPVAVSKRSQTWERLMKIKERVKRLHRKVNWLRMIDVTATNCGCTVEDVGKIEVGSFTIAVDTRRRLEDRSRRFWRKKTPESDRRPAEWILTAKSILFSPEGKEAVEILDQCSLTVHGILQPKLDGLRDSRVSLKLGRVFIPSDDFALSWDNYQRGKVSRQKEKSLDSEVTLTDLMEELDIPGTREEQIIQAVSDSKDFISSILRGIQEIQFVIGFARLSKKITSVRPTGIPLFVHFEMKEVGMDLHRLDPKSAAHRMYFPAEDIAHEALFAALGLSIDVDDGHAAPERLVYIPMTTITMKTTLPSKTMEFSKTRNIAERNTNIVFANVVFTSPSVDLDPKHLPLTVLLVGSKSRFSGPKRRGSHRLISRLLPKASIKLSVHEPVVRISLPPLESSNPQPDEFDLLISSNSSISLDLESSHSSAGELHYAVVCNMRVTSHHLYYQTLAGTRHNLSMTEAFEFKVQLSATPELLVVANGNVQSFSLHLVRPEISEGLHQIVKQLRSALQNRQYEIPDAHKPSNFVRASPRWLLSLKFRGTGFRVEVAGIDGEISKATRGLALQLESWTMEYRANGAEEPKKRPTRHRAMSNPAESDEAFLKVTPPLHARMSSKDTTDGRRLAVHAHGFEGFIIESLDSWEPDPFLSIPRSEVAFSTASDGQGMTFHVNVYLKTIFAHLSLFRLYSMGVAAVTLRKAFGIDVFDSTERGQPRPGTAEQPPSHVLEDQELMQSPIDMSEVVIFDVRSTLIQVKTTMPADPPMMLQIYSLDAGRHRWGNPIIKGQLLRLYAGAPSLRRAWARLLSIKQLRVDLRASRRKVGMHFQPEQSVDIAADAFRFSIPHQMILYKIFDNFVNSFKSTLQLAHRFKTGTNEYILQKNAEGPKYVRRISVRSRAALFEIEDSPFEWKLSTIYRVGLIEQKQRLAREHAYEEKTRKMHERQYPGGSRLRNHSAHPLGRSQERESPRRHDGGRDNRPRSRSSSPPGHRGRKMRYDPDGTCDLSGAASVSPEEAWMNLQRYNSQSWKIRVDSAMRFMKRSMKEIRGAFWGRDESPELLGETEPILAVPQRPGLLAALINDLNLVIDRPSFPVTDYAKFLYKIGKNIPHDTKYSLLIPMGIKLEMGETRVSLRDYPLPLLHVPAIRSYQSARLPSWSVKTDFVIAEEYRDSESTRHVQVNIVPPENPQSAHRKGGFAVDVRRTVSPVKTYSDVQVDINTGNATKIAWGTSYQPAIQDMMMIVETFTKPQADPSSRTGFWDKIRLTVHSRINVEWKGDGDVHLLLKGSRDPYVVTGFGAGFVMCWRNNVRWRICQDEDPRKFMTVDSGDYILAIPDYSHQARTVGTSERHAYEGHMRSSSSSQKNSALFKKVIMKLSGNVRWLAGLVFERNTQNGGRSFQFKPHYDITLKNPEFAKATDGEVYDAFKGFRSHHIHLSLAVTAPENRNWSVTNLDPSPCYNSVHLTPRFFTHFFDWWSLFSGVMSLPIRQGNLWPGVEKSSKKFGRHLATIKYNLLLSPLFMSHIYKHKDAEDYAEDLVSATGLKTRLDSFMLDLHQRREDFTTNTKGRKVQMKTSSMRINQAQLDFISADIRAISASIAGTSPEELKRATDETLASYSDSVPSVDMSRFTIPDNDFSWIDMDDFVELDWILPAESNPETKIIPLVFAPRFTYFRQTDHQDDTVGDTTRSSPFGNENTHFCVMSQDNDPRKVQFDLVQDRLNALKKQVEHHGRLLGDAELKVIKDATADSTLRTRLEELKRHGETLKRKERALLDMRSRLSERVQLGQSRAVPDQDQEFSGPTEARQPGSRAEDGFKDIDSSPLAESASNFNNRFIIHNMQMKWNNTLRNIILRYIHQVSQRRGFVYYMSRRAVKFILDIVEEQNKSKRDFSRSDTNTTSQDRESHSSSRANEESGTSVEDRIRQLLGDDNKLVNAEDSNSKGTDKPTTNNIGENIAEDFTPQNSYHLRLIAPQIQFQSDKNPKSAVLMTAESMQLKVLQIMDKDRVADDVSGLVQRRFSAEMESMQCFVTSQKTFAGQLLHMFSGNRYGTSAGSSWPPWVPLEVMFDFETNPFGFSRLIKKTYASLRYDKYNTLRLKYNDEVTGLEDGNASGPDNVESRIDHIYVEFPTVRAICDSSQYYAIYIIILDLLLYSEPLEKVRNERLEKIMLASDFSDLRGAPEMVIALQERIRQLEEIKMHFQLNAKYLDRRGWEDRLAIEQDLTGCEDELFFMMKAITTAQRRYDDRSDSNGILKWHISAYELVWHLKREEDESLVEFQLQNAAYDRTDNSDGSNHNAIQIERIRGLNLLPNALYPQMIAPFLDNSRSFAEVRETKMLRVYWYMLEAIAGIPVMDHFEVNLFPLKIQLEREIGQKLFEYIFPGVGSNAFDSGGFSPFMIRQIPGSIDEDKSDEEDDPNWTQMDDFLQQDESKAPNTALEIRLKPTLTLPENKPAQHDSTPKLKWHHGEHNHHFRLFQPQNQPKTTSKLPVPSPQKKQSAESLRVMRRSSHDRSHSSLSSLSQIPGSEKSRRFGLRHSISKERPSEDDKPSDDLTQMMTRASNYMTLAYVKIPSMVLCLSYKDKGERNIRDLHDFVFRMPILEYRNKTWSNLDLALHLKRDIVRALISHTGAIIGNKLSHHRPARPQASKLREVANAATLHPTRASTRPQDDSASPSGHDSSPTESASASPRPSMASAPAPQNHIRPRSYSSSIRSLGIQDSIPSSGVSSREKLSLTERQGNNEEDQHGIHNSLSRHLTNLSHKARHRDGIADESEESHRRKSALLLGRKILGSLN